MRVLLDTSYLYNLMDAPGRLTDAERLILSNPDIMFFVSAVSVWEMRLKFAAHHRSGARKSRFDPQDIVSVLEDQDFIFLPMTISHAAAKLGEPIPHKDPFDEMLLIQAQEEGLRLLTADRQLIGHSLAIAP